MTNLTGYIFLLLAIILGITSNGFLNILLKMQSQANDFL